ncbi:MAG: type II toxin-antitoxin system VapC family toxin [Patescibacteria group bacterium]
MKNKLLADSDFFIALYKSNDSNNDKALKILEQVGEKELELTFSVFVYAEVTTVLSMRVGKKTARHFMDDVEKVNFDIIQNTEALFWRSRKILYSMSSKNISFTDVTNLALAELEGFDLIASFDRHYPKNGLKLFR